jgi:hypothetical protein
MRVRRKEEAESERKKERKKEIVRQKKKKSSRCLSFVLGNWFCVKGKGIVGEDYWHGVQR